MVFDSESQKVVGLKTLFPYEGQKLYITSDLQLEFLFFTSHTRRIGFIGLSF